jgi:uncharacterized phage-associated protein
MTTSARNAADEIRKRIPSVGELKLHKLLYYSQGHHLAAFDVPLFGDTISAWDMGPVVGTLWYAEKNEGPQHGDETLGEAELNTIAYVVSRYGGLTGSDLIRLSHSEPPWQDANAHRPAGMSVRIEQESIRAYFAHLADEDEEEPVLDASLIKDFLATADLANSLVRSDPPDSHEEITARLAALSA